MIRDLTNAQGSVLTSFTELTFLLDTATVTTHYGNLALLKSLADSIEHMELLANRD